ncbi:type VI secretion system membrane subunit TssM [Rheinheimera maricola]|uniref:Type VI secretion system membrane subunit TssM n=1 Tax=Rheinheimera maricola TaxID=2793282 RepID=A0ABS7XFC9_9GAMM|nr:type VI secretion system membrane subunit TssM [Rheinheimera maricola]MBZ9613437.1 type VI secretion system membrane subunit TssM [Rheinheimera maricola]
MNFAKTKKIIMSKYFFQALGIFVISTLVWFVGPAIAISDSYILETISSRLLTIFVLIVGWVSYQAAKNYFARKNDAQFAENLTLLNAKQDEVNAIQERFNNAISTLKTAGSKKGALLLNSLPWYIIIGPPGSGKTTALVNSGLEFPLKDKLGSEAVKGIGGTRHCDWWFTNEAVLIDTAGRFTTQDSDAEIDKVAWQSFMRMLKKHRSQRPINGAIVTMSLSDMLVLSEDELSFYAKTIRRRIDELSEQLGVKFPVYFMFTKCDLISGFVPFFNNLSSKQRNQVWGETFELNKDGQSAVDISDYDLHFDKLLNRLQSILLMHLHQQNDPTKKADMLTFPAQMESMKGSIHNFLINIFGENSFQDSALLRGVYFTSGTQQGSPFDSLLGSIALDMGISLDDDVNFSGRGKSFFINDLLSKVIFSESNIAGMDRKRQRWLKRLQMASVSAAVCVFFLVSSIWYLSYLDNVAHIQSLEESVDSRQALISASNEHYSDFESILTELNEARNARNIFEQKTFTDNFGLSQKNSFDSHVNAAYLSALETRLLPMIAHRIEAIMLTILRDGNKADLYSFLKAYLMYSGQHTVADAPFESDWLKALSLADWQTTYPGKPEVVEALSAHLDYLLTHSFTYITPDESLVAQARNGLKQLPLEEQVYASIRDSLLASHQYDMLFSEIVGANGILAFTSRDGQPLDNLTVPGMYTKQGFIKSFMVKASVISDEYLANTWIMGPQNKLDNLPSKSELHGKVYNLYYREYINTWMSFLRGLSLKTAGDLSQGVFMLRAFADTSSPLDLLIRNVSEQTNLAEIAGVTHAVQSAAEVGSVVSTQAQRVISQTNRAARVAQKSGLMDLSGKLVTDQFAAFHRLVSNETGDARLVQLNANIAQYIDFLNKILSDSFSETPAFDAALNRINNGSHSDFGRLALNNIGNPPEVTAILNQLSNLGWQLILFKAHTEIQQAWRRQVLNVYQMSMLGRYPFDRNASAEVELADFAHFFAPQGVLNSFITKYVTPFIDTSGFWRAKSYGGVELAFNATALQKLQRGRKITESFFANNATMPSLKFSLLPESLNTNAAKFVMTLGTQKIEYAHGPRRYASLSWPSALTNEITKLEFIHHDGSSSSVSEMGPWSLFRILDAQVIKANPGSSNFSAVFAVNEQSINYELRASSESNPIGIKLLQNFTLPEEL